MKKENLEKKIEMKTEKERVKEAFEKEVELNRSSDWLMIERGLGSEMENTRSKIKLYSRLWRWEIIQEAEVLKEIEFPEEGSKNISLHNNWTSMNILINQENTDIQ